MKTVKPVFRPSFGNRPDQLVGRDDVIDKIIEGLNSYVGNAERATLIVGQRGMGKTALLLETADRARTFDYVAVRVTCGESMLDNLIELLQKEGSEFIKEKKVPIKGVSAGVLGFSLGLTFTEEAQKNFGFRVKLEMICERLAEAGKRVLILVDEVDPSVLQMRELAKAYQELAGEETDISIVMAGLPSAISDTLNYKTLTFLNRARRIELGLIPVSEVELYYHSAFVRASISASPEIIKEAAVQTGGFPYQIQLVGYYLSKMSEGGKKVDKKMLSRVVDMVSDEIDSKVFQAMLSPLSERDIYILQRMAEIGTTVKTSAIAKSAETTHGTMQTYRKRLMDAGILYSPRRGELEFVMPALADYLKRQA